LKGFAMARCVRLSLLSCAILLAYSLSDIAWAKDNIPSGLPRAKAADVGMNGDKLAEIPNRMKEFVAAGQISGCVTLVAKDGKVVALDAVGLRDVEGKQPMAEDTLFAIASMTKPITAAALMILVDEGKVALDDPVAKYIPEFKDAKLKDGSKPNREITVFDCLTHTSGVVGEQRNVGTIEETAKALAKRPLDFQPGEKWVYSPGLTIVGRVIEVAAKQPYEKFLSERIFQPLGMKDTSFLPTAEQQQRLAKLYKPGPEKGTLARATHWINEITPERTPNPSGGLFSTAADLARFYQMVLNGGELDGKRILSKEAIEKMTTLRTGELKTGFTEGNGWGLGWCVVCKPQGVTEKLTAGVCGHGGAFGTQGWIEPERKMIYVLLIQRTEFGNADGSDIRGALHNTAVEALP
jgi:CubicO group peptidase (beta-lactamase class C family)